MSRHEHFVFASSGIITSEILIHHEYEPLQHTDISQFDHNIVWVLQISCLLTLRWLLSLNSVFHSWKYKTLGDLAYKES